MATPAISDGIVFARRRPWPRLPRAFLRRRRSRWKFTYGKEDYRKEYNPATRPLCAIELDRTLPVSRLSTTCCDVSVAAQPYHPRR